MGKPVEMPLFTHQTTGMKAAMALMTSAEGKVTVHLIRFDPAEDGVPDSYLSDTTTLCGAYTGSPAGCKVEMMTPDNCPDSDVTEKCQECTGYMGPN